MPKAMSFDIDTTLTYETSWWKITKDLGANIKEHERIFNQMKKNFITYKDAKKQLIDLWRKTGNCKKDFLINIFKSVKLKRDTKEIISLIKLKNIIVTLITGGVDLYAKIIADRLGIKEYYANTKLIFDKNDNLIDFDYEKEQGNKKLNQFKEFCLKNQIKPEDCFIVGDDENDIELFKITKHGIAIKSPNSHKAEPYAWKIIDSLSKLKELV